MAKKLLEQKGVAYQEQNVDTNPELLVEMVRKTQRKTVPQIYIGELYVGGFNELYALEANNELDALLV